MEVVWKSASHLQRDFIMPITCKVASVLLRVEYNVKIDFVQYFKARFIKKQRLK